MGESVGLEAKSLHDRECRVHAVAELSTRNADEALRSALNMMQQAGFRIDRDVEVAVDEKLPFMGYTSHRWQSQSHIIVVSGFALKSPMLEGLLTHELSHIYRTITDHPSHNETLIASLMHYFIDSHKLHREYEQQILHQAINHVQDLYADDIAIRVLTAYQGALLRLGELGEFFLDWIKEEPARGGTRRRDQWTNVSILLNNCFAISNMERHGIVREQIEKARMRNDRFLKQIKPGAVMRFNYFNRLMVGLKEDVSETEFREQMKGYLRNFFETVDSI